MDPFASATATLRALHTRKLGALELLDAQLARVERFNGKLNAIIWTDLERARDAARTLDAQPAASEQPLRGLPMTVKESFDLAAAPTTWGMPALKDNVARRDSVVVERLRAAGAVVLGKTNVPFALGDLQSYNAIYGSTGTRGTSRARRAARRVARPPRSPRAWCRSRWARTSAARSGTRRTTAACSATSRRGG